MLASISPFGERARGQRWSVTVVAYVAGSVAGGAIVGGALGAISVLAGRVGDVDDDARLAALGVLAAGGFVLDALRPGRNAPGPARQVDENWLSTYRGWVYGAGFGLQLGAAFTTIVSSAITYVAFAAALLSGSVAGGALLGAVFGLVRALPLLGTARVDTPARLRDVMRRTDAALPRARVATFATQASVAIAAIGAIAAGGG
jgi:hypothetical protein